jgi:hypothetical protein
MRNIYEFVYLYIYNIVTNNGEKESNGSALFAFTGLLTGNVVFLLMVLRLLLNEALNLKWFVVLFYAGLSIINYFLFVLYDKSLIGIKLRWEKESDKSKSRWKRNIYRYIILSIVLFISPIILKILKQFS